MIQLTIQVVLYTPNMYIVQLNLNYEVTFGRKKKWPYKKGDLLNEVQFLWMFLWQDKKKMTL